MKEKEFIANLTDLGVFPSDIIRAKYNNGVIYDEVVIMGIAGSIHHINIALLKGDVVSAECCPFKSEDIRASDNDIVTLKKLQKNINALLLEAKHDD